MGQPPEVEGGKPDRRVFFGEGWVLLLGMLVFGTVGGYFRKNYKAMASYGESDAA